MPNTKDTNEEVKTPTEPQGKESDFNNRARRYQTEIEILQRKFNIVQRPIITPYGPDLQLMDATQPQQAPSDK